MAKMSASEQRLAKQINDASSKKKARDFAKPSRQRLKEAKADFKNAPNGRSYSRMRHAQDAMGGVG